MSDPAKDGIYITKEYCRTEFLPTDLQWTVSEIDADVTLFDIFRLAYQAEIMIPGIAATLGMSNFQTFWDQINKDRDIGDDSNIQYLELYWHIGYDTRVTKKTGIATDQGDRVLPGRNDNNYWDDPKVAELSNLMGFHGIGPGCPCKDLDFHECGSDCPKDTAYAIELTPVNNLAHLPVRVSPNIDFYPPFVEFDRDFLRTGFQLSISPTLWCFITSIFWELTFFGSTPDQVEDKLQDLQGSCDEAKEQMGKEDTEE